MINNNEYEYVDLGLPSGTLWTTCNIGADRPSDGGLYFQWGDTKGYTSNQVETGSWKKKFALDWGDDCDDYKRNPNGDCKTFIKYIKEGAKLELEDDAAHIHMGGDWHIPTPNQIQELIDNTTSNFETVDGVRGMKFTANNEKSIFIPAAGLIYEKSILNSGCTGTIWSSMLSESYVGNGQHLYFNPVYLFLDSSCGRYIGRSVRGVIG